MNTLLIRKLLFFIELFVLFLTMGACDFELVKTLTEEEYDLLKYPIEDYNDLIITLSTESSILNYFEDTLTVNMELSVEIDSDEIDSDLFVLENGRIYSITPTDSSSSRVSKNFTIKIVPLSPSYDVIIYVPELLLKIDTEYINKSASNSLIIEYDIFDHGRITDLSWSNDNQSILGLDYENDEILRINPFERSLTKLQSTVNSYPYAMKYDETDNKLFVVSYYSGDVDIYDLDDNSVNSYQFSATLDGRDIEIDTSRNRAFILTSSAKLIILDTSDGSVLHTATVDTYIRSIAYDETNQFLFAGESGISPSSILRYSVAGDVLVEQEELSNAGYNGRTIVINPAHTIVCLPCGGGNTGGYTIDAFEAGNLSNVLGTWDVGTYPKMAFFNPVKEIFYGCNGDSYDNYLYVMNSNDFSLIKKLQFPDCDETVLFSTNIDGTAAIGFTYDSSYEISRLHLFTDIE